MSESVKEQIPAELQNAKSEERMRTERIYEIVRDAFSQTIAEVKEGSGEIKAIAKESLSKILKTLNEKSEESQETNEKAPSTSSNLLALFKAIKNRLFVYLHQEYKDLPNQYTQLKNRAVNLDTNLTERYGDRYIAVKQRLEKGVAWYNTVAVQAKTTEPTVLQQRQVEVENQLGEAGATLAQKERHIKQQLKERLQSAVAKL